jgi:hypothetical protein
MSRAWQLLCRADGQSTQGGNGAAVIVWLKEMSIIRVMLAIRLVLQRLIASLGGDCGTLKLYIAHY